jgi:hypothetical protein
MIKTGFLTTATKLVLNSTAFTTSHKQFSIPVPSE